MVWPATERKRAQENMWPIASSATELEEAFGVFFTVMPLSSAYFTSMLSTPTPPRIISFNLPPFASSMWLARTFVALRTTTASKSFSAAPSSSGA